MRSFNEWVRTENTKTITITCRDQDNTLEKLLEYIKSSGNCGHSFSIVVDPKDEGEKKFFWDGDGSDTIHEIKIS